MTMKRKLSRSKLPVGMALLGASFDLTGRSTRRMVSRTYTRRIGILRDSDALLNDMTRAGQRLRTHVR